MTAQLGPAEAVAVWEEAMAELGLRPAQWEPVRRRLLEQRAGQREAGAVQPKSRRLLRDLLQRQDRLGGRITELEDAEFRIEPELRRLTLTIWLLEQIASLDGTAREALLRYLDSRLGRGPLQDRARLEQMARAWSAYEALARTPRDLVMRRSRIVDAIAAVVSPAIDRTKLVDRYLRAAAVVRELDRVAVFAIAGTALHLRGDLASHSVRDPWLLAIFSAQAAVFLAAFLCVGLAVMMSGLIRTKTGKRAWLTMALSVRRCSSA
jgi:hypothetical protein